MTKRYLVDDQKGVALFTVVLIFLVLVTMLGGVMFAAVVNQRNSIVAKNHTAVYYAAESGINLKIADIAAIISSEPDYGKIKTAVLALTPDYNLEANMGKKSWATTSVTEVTDSVEIASLCPGYNLAYNITSIGKIGSDATVEVSRTLSTYVCFRPSGPFDGAIVTKGSIYVHNSGAIIDGSIASNLDNNTTINLNKNATECNHIDGISVFDLEDGDVYGAENCVNMATSINEIMFPDIKLPNGEPKDPVKIITQSHIDQYLTGLRLGASNRVISVTGNNNNKVGTLDLSAGDKFKINSISDDLTKLTIQLSNDNAEDKEIHLILDDEIETLPAEIVVNGKGRLIIVSKFGKTFIGDSIITTQDPKKKVTFVLLPSVNKNPAMDLGSKDRVFVANIMSYSKGKIIIKGETQGYIISLASLFDGKNPQSEGDIEIQTPNAIIGEGSWLYAPYAHVYMQANSNYNGSIMAESYWGQSNIKLVYKGLGGDNPFANWITLPYENKWIIKYLPIIED